MLKNNLKSTIISILMIFISFLISKNILLYLITLLPGLIIEKLLFILTDNQRFVNITVFLILCCIYYFTLRYFHIRNNIKEISIYIFFMLLIVNPIGFYLSNILNDNLNDGQTIYSYSLLATSILFLVIGIILDYRFVKNIKKSNN
jgi:hypothetical protein